MLTLYVDHARWRRHLRGVVDAHPGIVPVAKGNGYGLHNSCLASVSQELGADTIAVGTYAEVTEVADAFSGDILVLTPWRPFETRATYHPRLVHTLGRLDDLAELATRGADAMVQPRAVLELVTSMRRHGFTPRGLREAGRQLDGVAVEGFALHLPISHGSHLSEMRRLLDDLVASRVPTRRVYVSHLSDLELATLRTSYADFDFRPRIGTELWLGDRGALRVRASVLDVHEVRRGDVFGYRGRTAPRRGHIIVVSGGTAHGIGLEAPTGGATIRDRAARVARGGLDAAGFVRSPFTIAGKQRLFAEPPHMQASMLFLPEETPPPPVGAEIDVQVRFTVSTFDRIEFG